MTVVEELRTEIARLTKDRDAALALLREAPSHKTMQDHRYWNWSKKRIVFLDGLEMQKEAAR